MSKLILWNLISLDGFLEGSTNWQLDWHHLILDEEFFRFAADQLRTADRLIFGRITYEGMAAHWPKAEGEIADLMNALPKVVFSRTLTQANWANTTIVKDNPAAELRKLKQVGNGNSLVMESGKLAEALMAEKLFDEYRLLVAPVILGSGKSLFGRGTPRQNLKLVESRQLASGGVILRYEPA